MTDPQHTPAGLVAWMGRNLLIVLPVLAAAGGLLGFAIFEGPKAAFQAVYGWTLSDQQRQIQQAEACKARLTAMDMVLARDPKELTKFREECPGVALMPDMNDPTAKAFMEGISPSLRHYKPSDP